LLALQPELPVARAPLASERVKAMENFILAEVSGSA
jgi:hypothetical protein